MLIQDPTMEPDKARYQLPLTCTVITVGGITLYSFWPPPMRRQNAIIPNEYL